MANPEWVWFNGEFVPFAEAKLHVRTQTTLFGANVFEGIRGYWNPERQELYAFKLEPHLKRLAQSMKIMRMTLPFGLDEIGRASLEFFRRNGIREDAHITPVVYFGDGASFAFDPREVETGAFILGGPRTQGKALEQGYRCCVSSWRRIDDSTIPPRLKAGANYQNSRMAAYDAKIDGYDSVIILNQHGTVAEGPGACVFIVRDGVPITPPVTDSILESITRDTLIELFRRELGIEPVERPVDRTELYVADEAFFCGSGWEITPIVEIDRLPVGTGKRGPVTEAIQNVYFDVVRGRRPAYEHWLTPVYGGVAAGHAEVAKGLG